MGSQVANVYPQAEVAAESKTQLSNLYPQAEVLALTKTQLSNLFSQYEVDYPKRSQMANAIVQYELAINPLDSQSRIANLLLQVELQPLLQNPEFGPRLSSET
jgi:hypothetical protein